MASGDFVGCWRLAIYSSAYRLKVLSANVKAYTKKKIMTTNKYLLCAALKIKEYSHVLRFIGGIFFILTLLSGIIWICGKDIESTAFLLGLISSTFLYLPSIANYLAPNRKPIRYMDYEEILDFIPNSDPKKDWHGISKTWSSEMFLKEDPRLRFRARFDDEGIQSDDFIEPWANNYANPKAVGYWYELYYDGAFIDRVILVAVDGAKAMLPLPLSGTTDVILYNYKVAQIHDTLNTLESYMSSSKLNVKNS